MNRALKFRAWDKFNKQWLFGYEFPNLGGFSLTGEVVLLGELSSIPLQKWNNIAITQFTGIPDKNGKEIYEGDLAKVKVCDWATFTGEVVFHDGAWWLKTGETHRRLSKTIEDIEVVGNIFENPELQAATQAA